MSASTSKPPNPNKEPRRRTQSLIVRCDIANCGFSARTTKTVQKHKEKTHEVKHLNDTTFDQSVSSSILDDTKVEGASASGTDSLDHKTSADFYQEVSNVQQSTQLEVTGRRRDRSSDEEEDEEEDKRRKLNTEEPEQSQGEKDRQAVRDRALATVAASKQRVTSLNDSESLLLEETEAGKPLQSADLFADSDSMLLVTARETVYDSLSLARTDSELTNLEDKLQKSNDSLRQALSRVAELEESKGTIVRKIEALENKVSKKHDELVESTNAIKQLTDKLERLELEYDKVCNANPDAKAARKNVSLTNKVSALEKKVAELKDLLSRAQENADKQCDISDGFKAAQHELLAQIVILKRQTICKEENCTNEKECGRSHVMKEENRGQCDYFNYGRCRNGNTCRFKHDQAAKQKFHDEEKKRKQEEKELKEQEEKEEKKRKEDASKKEEVKKKEEAKAASKKEKLKRKRKNRKERKTEDSNMEVDDDSLDGSTVRPLKKKAKAAPKPATKTVKGNDTKSKAKTQSDDAPDHNPEPPVQPPIASNPAPNIPADMSRPPPNFNHFQSHLIPTSFNFAPGYRGAPPSLSPSYHQGSQGWPTWQGGPAPNTFPAGPMEEVANIQPLSRKARLDNLRSEIAAVQGQIIAVQNGQGQGNIDIRQLVTQELALKQRLYEQSYNF